MGKIIELRRRESSPAARAGADGDVVATLSALDQSARTLVASAEKLIETLEASLECVRARIGTIADVEASGRLEREHAILSAALRDAKAQVAGIDRVNPKI
jgi:hypothetical protein